MHIQYIVQLAADRNAVIQSHAPGLVQVNPQSNTAGLTLIFHVDQFQPFFPAQRIGQADDQFDNGLLLLPGFDANRPALSRRPVLRFLFVASLGHITTDRKNKNGRTARFHVNTDYGYRHLPVHKTTPGG